MKAGFDYIGLTTPFYCTDGKGKFLLHKRSKKCRDEQGRWDTGGGQLEFGQTPEQNVLREIREEYGCKGRVLSPLPSYSLIRKVGNQKTHWIALPFLILLNPEDVFNNEPDKIDEIAWFSLSNFPTPLHTGVRLALKKFRKLLQSYVKKAGDLV